MIAPADAATWFYSGTALYQNEFTLDAVNKNSPIYLTIDSVFNIATVVVNGIDCGTLWTPPYKLDITKTLKPGKNSIEIKVSNTWRNRLIKDLSLPEEERVTWTTAPLEALKNKPLSKAGLEGKVRIEQ